MKGFQPFRKPSVAESAGGFLLGASSTGEAVQIPEQVGAVNQAGGVALARIAKAGASDSLAGHASAEMNMNYTHREVESLRGAMKKLPGLKEKEAPKE